MQSRTSLTAALALAAWSLAGLAPVRAGYEAHKNDRDLGAFLEVHPTARGGRLDSCATCHPAGTLGGKAKQAGLAGQGGRVVDACTYCHETHGIVPPHGPVPLNPYGVAYKAAGRSPEAVRRLMAVDADGDGATTWREVQRGTNPGDPADRPGLARPPQRRFSLADLERLPRTSSTLLINTSKGQDYYATFEGVSFEDLLVAAGASPSADRVTFFSADGYQMTLPLRAAQGWRLLGDAPPGRFHAGLSWVKYPAGLALAEGAELPGPARALLAFRREGLPLEPGSLPRNGGRISLRGEGPYRLVVPQAHPSAPDQSRTDPQAGAPFPYERDADHNADACVRCVVALRVEPLPEGCGDEDWSREAWDLARSATVVVYGALGAGR